MEWYSNIADEKSGAWTTDTGMFGGDVSQTVTNNSNILNVKTAGAGNRYYAQRLVRRCAVY